MAIENSVEENVEDGRWMVMNGLKGLKGLAWTPREWRNHKLRRKEYRESHKDWSEVSRTRDLVALE